MERYTNLSSGLQPAIFNRKRWGPAVAGLRLLPGAVVLLLVDLLGQLVLLLVERMAVSGGEMAAVWVRICSFSLVRFASLFSNFPLH